MLTMGKKIDSCNFSIHCLKKYALEGAGLFAAGGVVIRCLQNIEFLHIPSEVSFCLWGMALILYFLQCRVLRFDWSLLCFIGVSMGSMVLMDREYVAESCIRFVGFICALLVISPLINNRELFKIRCLMWSAMLWTLRSIVVLSVLYCCYYLFDTLLIKHSEFSPWVFNRGVTSQGMTISPIAAIVAIDSFENSMRRAGRGCVGWIIMWLLSVLMAIIGGSRIALIGCLLGHCVIGWFYRDVIVRKWRGVCGIIAALLLVISLSWSVIGGAVEFKTRLGLERGSLLSSRHRLWHDRLEEFKSNPIFGIGFDAPTSVKADKSRGYVFELRQAEPGSSWMWILSSTGCMGGIFMLCFLYRMGKNLLRDRLSKQIAIFAALYVFMLVNGIAEGWITYPGSTMFMIFWLLCGVISEGNWGIAARGRETKS